jgi:hypothetical protein
MPVVTNTSLKRCEEQTCLCGDLTQTSRLQVRNPTGNLVSQNWVPELDLHAQQTGWRACDTGDPARTEQQRFHETMEKCTRASQIEDWHLNCVLW